jgi:cytochrome bd-type quinol oxidase subunit 2
MRSAPAAPVGGGWREWVRPAIIAASIGAVVVFIYMFGARLASGIPFDEEDDKSIEHFE